MRTTMPVVHERWEYWRNKILERKIKNMEYSSRKEEKMRGNWEIYVKTKDIEIWKKGGTRGEKR
jgi:hypothetical protein